jgi:hypothetical protein
MAGFTASTTVPGDATSRAAAPILRVIEAVVLGLTTRRCMDLLFRQEEERFFFQKKNQKIFMNKVFRGFF